MAGGARSRRERFFDREVKARFPAGAVRRVALADHDDDPTVEPDEVLVRVFVESAGQEKNDQAALDSWAQIHETEIRRLRRELSLGFPRATLLEFTFDQASDPDARPRVAVPHDPALVDQPLSGPVIVHTAIGLLRRGYVFPERAEEAASVIEARLASGDYDDLEETQLADRLTAELDELCEDKHLGLRVVPARAGRVRPSDPGPEARQQLGRPFNCGVFRAERLDGNVGYLDLRAVFDPEIAAPVIAAAMELVAGTYALIIDLRRNRGGSPQGVVLWCSYLFPDAEVHLNDVFNADTGETRQYWTLASVPGSRYVDRPVYLLTSHETFSGGEDFCYTLQAQGRAEVIGEKTGGGAHPTKAIPISKTLAMSVPFARSINPITGTNWQGTGVVPDVEVPAAEAFDVAYEKALRHVASIESLPPPIADEARGALDELAGRDGQAKGNSTA